MEQFNCIVKRLRWMTQTLSFSLIGTARIFVIVTIEHNLVPLHIHKTENTSWPLTTVKRLWRSIANIVKHIPVLAWRTILLISMRKQWKRTPKHWIWILQMN